MAKKKVASKKKAVAALSGKPATRRTFTPEARAKILAEAMAQKLTGKEVAKKHGISMVTYYLWRKKAGVTRRWTGRRGKVAVPAGLRAQMRAEVQTKVRRLLPGIVRDEVAKYLKTALK